MKIGSRPSCCFEKSLVVADAAEAAMDPTFAFAGSRIAVPAVAEQRRSRAAEAT